MYIYIYIWYPPQYPGRVLFKSDAFSLIFVFVFLCSCASLGKQGFVYCGSWGFQVWCLQSFCSRNFSKFMEIVGNVGKTNIFHDLFAGNHGTLVVLPTFPTISMIPETMAWAPREVFPNSWKLFEMLAKPTFSMICLWGIMELVGFTNISNNFHDSRNYGSGPEVSPDSWDWLILLVSPTVSTGPYLKTVFPQVAIGQILCTRARCVADKAGKVFASLIKVKIAA